MKIAPYKIDSYIENIATNKDICGAVIYGLESGLVLIRAQKIARNIVADVNDPFLITNITAKQIEEDKGLLADEFCAVPMLGGRKLVAVSNIGNKVTECLKLIFLADKKEFKKPSSENFILITAAQLDSSSSLRKFAESNPYIACLACYEDSEETSTQIIRQKFQEYQLTTENGVIEFIINKFGKNRLIILNELEKLALFMGEDRHVTMGIIEQTIADISQISIAEFIHYFADLNLENAIYFLDKLFAEKINAITLIRFLSGYFLKLQTVKSNIANGGYLEAEIKAQRIFFKQEILFKKHLNQWPIRAIDNILLKLQELEVSCKSANINQATLLASFVNFTYLKYRSLNADTNLRL